MTDDIKAAFDEIRAEDSLKAATLAYLRVLLREQNRQKSFMAARRGVIAIVSLCVLLLCVFSYNVYFVESMYVAIDVNPSIELSINRFDRVIDMYAYNDEGKDILEMVRIKHKNYEDAIGALIDAMIRKEYAKEDGLVSITLQSDKEDRENRILANLESLVRKYYLSAEVEAFTVASSIRNAARELNLSPARYLAILDLQEVNPNASVESCRNHSIRELRRLTEEHTKQRQGNLSAVDDVGVADDVGAAGHDWDHSHPKYDDKGYHSGDHNGGHE